MPTPFPDRSETLFGRARDLDRLMQRTHRPGVTFLFGDSQIGKSTLLKEVARRRSLPVPPSLLGPAPCLSGYAESQGQNEDLFLLAVADLYTRWITGATYAEQARLITQQQKKDFIGRFGEALGTTFEKLSKLGGKPSEVVGGAANTLLRSLAAANRDLLSGGLQITPLSIDQGRDLLTMVHSITRQPILLILDQWEKARLPVDANLLESVVRHLASEDQDWPPCHILVAAIPQDAPKAAAEDLRSGFPAEVEVHTLSPMDLEDPIEAAALLSSVRDRVPAAAELDDAAILDLIAGHPEVVNRWTKREPIQTVARMKELAAEAHTHRFSELKILPKLPPGQRTLAMRLALLPVSNASPTWTALRPLLMEGVETADLDTLNQTGILEPAQSTFFGHAKRSEVALQTFAKATPNSLTDLADRLCIKLASQVHDLSPQSEPFTQSLLRLHPDSSGLCLSVVGKVICQAARTLYEPALLDLEEYRSVRMAAGWSGTSTLLAIGLNNTLVYARQENDLTRGDDLLDELRSLANAFPTDAPICGWLATGVFNTLYYAKHENTLTRRDELLDELRALADAFPTTATVRERLAMGLFNTLNAARRENKFIRRDDLLDELRALTRKFATDVTVRESLAKGLFNTLIGAKEENTLARRDDLLDELRALANAFRTDASVGVALASGLFNTLIDAKQEDTLTRRDDLLDELRALANAFPTDAPVREVLAKGLFNTLNDARQEDTLTRRDDLLDELRALANAFPTDAPVREWLAKGLVNTLNDAKQEDTLTRRDDLLDELRAVANAFPTDAPVREQLATGLFNTLTDAKQEDTLTRRDDLLDELRTLANAFPSDAPVREQLAKGLVICSLQCREEGGIDRAEDLLMERKGLRGRYPDDPVWTQIDEFLQNQEA